MDALLTAYDELFLKSQPVWTQKMTESAGLIPPTIPFIGKEYGKTRVLLYASAENLSHYKGHGSISFSGRVKARKTTSLSFRI